MTVTCPGRQLCAAGEQKPGDIGKVPTAGVVKRGFAVIVARVRIGAMINAKCRDLAEPFHACVVEGGEAIGRKLCVGLCVNVEKDAGDVDTAFHRRPVEGGLAKVVAYIGICSRLESMLDLACHS